MNEERLTMLIIRDMISEDAEEKGFVHYKSWLETYDGLMNPDFLSKHTLERCIHIAKTYPERTIVAVYDHHIVGFAAYLSSCDSKDDRGEVMAIYVLKDYQKLGIGKALMDECINRLHAHDEVSVWVLHNNLAAITWYEKYGFKQDGNKKSVKVMEDYSLDEVRMSLSIKNIHH